MNVKVKLAEGNEALAFCGTPDINRQTSAHLRPDQSLKDQVTIKRLPINVVVGSNLTSNEIGLSSIYERKTSTWDCIWVGNSKLRNSTTLKPASHR